MWLFNSSLELLILDVDGTILDLMCGFQKKLETAARQVGLPLEPIEKYLALLQAGEREGTGYGFLSVWPGIRAEEMTQFMGVFREEERKQPYPAVPGSIDAIAWFRQKGLPIALCTGNDKENLDYNLRRVGIDPAWFALLKTLDETPHKPDPKVLDIICTTLAVPREHAVYVGDWYPDIEMARAAEIQFIGVLSGSLPLRAFIREGIPPDHILNSLGDLPKIVKE